MTVDEVRGTHDSRHGERLHDGRYSERLHGGIDTVRGYTTLDERVT